MPEFSIEPSVSVRHCNPSRLVKGKATMSQNFGVFARCQLRDGTWTSTAMSTYNIERSVVPSGEEQYRMRIMRMPYILNHGKNSEISLPVAEGGVVKERLLAALIGIAGTFCLRGIIINAAVSLKGIALQGRTNEYWFEQIDLPALRHGFSYLGNTYSTLYLNTSQSLPMQK
ncbi:MAG TPA: hypothetical protein VJC17_04050 [Candidatus Dojkabacteria bacterium]|nr:hypothetical protein [Candidatus Dojkabacteria bacterium]